MDRVLLYIKESYEELVHKVTWSNMTDLLNATKIVVISSVVFTLIVLGVDFISKTLTNFFYNL